MWEVGKAADCSDVKMSQPEDTEFRKIKPEGDMTFQEAQKIMDELLIGETEESGEALVAEQKNPRVEERDGVKYYYDDKGKLYRTGNDLTPDSEYEINGYRYKTDDRGRILSAEGKLHLKDREGRLPIKDSMDIIGKGDQKQGDERGHLIGDQFDGSNGMENMIPQDADINGKDFRNFENELAKEAKDGKEVKVKVEPVYDGDSRRPLAIAVTYKIDGEEGIRIFPNHKEAKS